tara:strand:- start:122 stop:994 length:873 start_codon:yes stop_codon:yes gene_type:complete
MPLKGFKYPDGEIVSLEDVNNRDVDVERMGMAMPTLLYMSKQRDNNRPPSTTELLIGTCQAYLQRTEDYYVDPQDNAFSLAGTIHHNKLEDSAEDESMLAEIALKYKDITGIVDLYDSKSKSLIDYKNTGSYKASQILGIRHRTESDPIEVYKKSGRWGKAGTPKQVKVFYRDPATADFGDWSWQVNFYRLMLEKNGYPVDNMYLQMTIRDGGVHAAMSRGIYKNIYLVEIPTINNDVLEERFLEKRDTLVSSLENKKQPEMCTPEETWNGRKCERYCPVREVCPHIERE